MSAAVAALHDRMVAEGAFDGMHPIARETVEDILGATTDVDLVPGVMRYGRALDQEIRAHAAWVEAGSPTVHVYPNKMVGPHPLAKAARDTARHAERMAHACGCWLNGAKWRRTTYGAFTGAEDQ